MFKYLIQGLLIGLAYVAPIGTQNLFVINTALTQKRKRTLITAFIVCFFDVSLSISCFYGVGALMSKSIWLELAIILIGSIVVIYIGISLLRSKGELTDVDTNIPIKKIIWTAFVVTWFNPQALIDGSMLFGPSNATIPEEFRTPFIIGAALASVIWWFGMSSLVNLIQNKITPKVLRIINIVCGTVIIFYGFKLLYSGITMAIGYFS